MIRRFKKKPIIIEAILFDGTKKSFEEISLFTDYIVENREGSDLSIPTLEGVMVAKVGDWIIKGVNGEFYPCKPDIFDKTYEEIKQSGKE